MVLEVGQGHYRDLFSLSLSSEVAKIWPTAINFRAKIAR